MQAIANYYLILMLKHFKDAVQVYNIIKAGISAQCVAAIMQNNLDFSGGNFHYGRDFLMLILYR